MTSPISPELQSKIASWRLRAAEGTLSLDEMKEGVRLIRGDRMSAASAAATAKRTKSKIEAPPADDMLGELAGL